GDDGLLRVAVGEDLPDRIFENDLIGTAGFNGGLDRLLQENDALLVDMFQDSIRQILADRDPEEPIIAALIDNDTYDWAPSAPTLLYYCTEDEQVPFRNALLADSIMRANGSTSVVTESGGPLDHGECVIPAAMRTIAFFQDRAVRNPVSLGEPVARPDIELFPNPVRAGESFWIQGLTSQAHDFVVYDPSGRQVFRGQTDLDGSVQIPTTLPRGLNLLRVALPDGTSVIRKFLHL
ncbi:MAG: T9SS type A sorting domain-containing protein, partial [Bacteroidota bacterium]